MDYLLKRYIERCKDEFAEYGFIRKDRTFARMVGDVVQNFTLKKYQSGREVTVVFAVRPICFEIVSIDFESYDLRNLGDNTVLWGPWEYDNKSTANMDACVEELINQIKLHLLPVFDRAVSSVTALHELIQLEKRLYKNRKDSPILMLDSVKYYMALKVGDYDFALRSRKSLLQQNIDAFASVSAAGFLSAESIRKREDAIEARKNEITHLEAADEQYFKDILLKNEANSIKFLKDNKIVRDNEK